MSNTLNLYWLSWNTKDGRYTVRRGKAHITDTSITFRSGDGPGYTSRLPRDTIGRTVFRTPLEAIDHTKQELKADRQHDGNVFKLFCLNDLRKEYDDDDSEVTQSQGA